MSRKGLFQPLVLAVVLATGFAVVWGVVGMWATELAMYCIIDDSPAESLAFLADGTPRLARQAGRNGEREYLDLEGNLVPGPEDATGWLSGINLTAALPDRASRAEVWWSQRLRSFSDGRVPATYWYLVADGRPDGSAYFVGYDSKSNARLGYLGTAGFREDFPPPAELFPFAGHLSGHRSRVFCLQPEYQPTEHPERPIGGRSPRGAVSPWDIYLLGRGGHLYHADLQARTVELALSEPRLQSAGLVGGIHDPLHGTPTHIAGRTVDAVLVLNERGQLLRRYPIPEALRSRNLTFGETTMGAAVEYWNGPMDDFGTQTDYRVWWVQPNGSARDATFTLPASGSIQSLVAPGSAAVVPSPIGLSALITTFFPQQLLDSGRASTYREAFSLSLQMTWPALVIAQLVAAVLALLCYRRQARYGASRQERILWPLFVLLVGLPGWIGYRFGRTWPVLEPCPSCDVDVPRDRDGCARCQAEFPPATRIGTEVFA
jgi:hypothetical protein